MTETTAAAIDRDRWRALYEWAVAHTAGRDDWEPVALLGAMQACKIAQVPYEDMAPVLWRLAWTEDDHRNFAELRVLVRARPVPGQTGPDVYARGASLARELLEQRARLTGPQPALPPEGSAT